MLKAVAKTFLFEQVHGLFFPCSEYFVNYVISIIAANNEIVKLSVQYTENSDSSVVF